MHLLENNADFLLGKEPKENFDKGVIDFVRISRGSLEDAKATFHKLNE